LTDEIDQSSLFNDEPTTPLRQPRSSPSQQSILSIRLNKAVAIYTTERTRESCALQLWRVIKTHRSKTLHGVAAFLRTTTIEKQPSLRVCGEGPTISFIARSNIDLRHSRTGRLGTLPSVIMPYSSANQCPCLTDAESVKALVFSMTHVSFEAILPACEELLHLAANTDTCTACVIRNSEILLTTCHQMALLLKSALLAHTPFPARLSLEASLGPSNIVCIPSPMFMGNLELNPRQSMMLAYDLIARKLRQIAAIVGQMSHVGAPPAAAFANHLLVTVLAMLEKLRSTPA
jgi:hypothetical protein